MLLGKRPLTICELLFLLPSAWSVGCWKRIYTCQSLCSSRVSLVEIFFLIKRSLSYYLDRKEWEKESNLILLSSIHTLYRTGGKPRRMCIGKAKCEFLWKFWSQSAGANWARESESRQRGCGEIVERLLVARRTRCKMRLRCKMRRSISKITVFYLISYNYSIDFKVYKPFSAFLSRVVRHSNYAAKTLTQTKHWSA